jgi:hypothetical protein
MAKFGKNGKMDFKKIAINAALTAGTGAVAQVLKEAVLVNDPETMDYIMIGAGLVLPELVKSPEVGTVGNAMLAIGAYRMADREGLAAKLGINDEPVVPSATSGLPGQSTIGNGWRPAFQEPGRKTDKANPGATKTVQ